jgi:hypothetical protein
MDCRVNDRRLGGNAKITRLPGKRRRTASTGALKSLSAEISRAVSKASFYPSHSNCTAMFTSVIFSWKAVYVWPHLRHVTTFDR